MTGKSERQSEATIEARVAVGDGTTTCSVEGRADCVVLRETTTYGKQEYLRFSYEQARLVADLIYGVLQWREHQDQIVRNYKDDVTRKRAAGENEPPF